MKFSLASADRLTDLLRAAFGSVRYSTLTIERYYSRMGEKKYRHHKMMIKQQYATEAFITVMGYTLMSTLTLGLIMPGHQTITSLFQYSEGVLLMPHTIHPAFGVIALAFLFFSYRAALYLYPALYLEWTLDTYGNHLDIQSSVPNATISAAFIGFAFYKHFIDTNIPKYISVRFMSLIVVIGLLNAIALASLHHKFDLIDTISFYFVGDLLGGVMCFAIYNLVRTACVNLGIKRNPLGE